MAIKSEQVWLTAWKVHSREGSQSSTSPADALSVDENCWHCVSERFWCHLAPGQMKTEISRCPYRAPGPAGALLSPFTFPHGLFPILASKVSQELQSTKPCLAQASALLAVPLCRAGMPVITSGWKLLSTSSSSMCTEFMASLLLKGDESTQHVDFDILRGWHH